MLAFLAEVVIVSVRLSMHPHLIIGALLGFVEANSPCIDWCSYAVESLSIRFTPLCTLILV